MAGAGKLQGQTTASCCNGDVQFEIDAIVIATSLMDSSTVMIETAVPGDVNG